MAAGKDAECRLLLLPAKLRNRVWEDVYEDNMVEWKEKRLGNGALLLTCKQIYHEAKGAYYRLSDFRITAEELLSHEQSTFLTLPIKSLQLITKIGILGRRYEEPEPDFLHLTFIEYVKYEARAFRIRSILDPFAAGESCSIRFSSGLQSEETWAEHPFLAFRTWLKSRSDKALWTNLDTLCDRMARYFDRTHVNPQTCWARFVRPATECACPHTVNVSKAE